MYRVVAGLCLGLISGACSAGAVSESPQSSSALTITVDGVRGEAGKLLLAIYEDPGEFASNGNSVMWLAVPAAIRRITLDQFPAGVFAISAFHDADNDGALDMNGELPLEGYGNSGSVEKWSEPSFEDASFTGRSASVQIHYLD